MRNAQHLHIFGLVAYGLTALFTSSHAASSPWTKNAHGQVRLLSAYDQAPEQGTLWLGLEFQTAPGWYVYWKMAGDAGYPPKATWEGSKGFKNPVWLWPQPTEFTLPGNIIEYGYEGDVVYPVKADLVSSKSGVHAFVTVSYLTCNTSCVPYKYTLELSLPQGKDSRVDSSIQDLIQRFVTQIPADRLTDEAIQKMAPKVAKHPMAEEETGGSGLSFSVLLLFAFIGGLLLNVMPCVLPVLSIKLLGLVQQSHHSRATIAKNALLSASGILASFLALAGLAIGARQAGGAVGWGIQFQNPFFVTFLMLVVFVFALNLWGVFEIYLPGGLTQTAAGYGREETAKAHFVSGLFVTLLATPCSAPFLGPAMGFALTQPTSTILSAFTVTGIGLAAPYLLLAIFPGSLHWLPKPGAWMISLKKWLSLLLFGTAFWLGWVLFHQLRPVQGAVFDEAQIQAYLAQGKPVLVDVTADWCVTCKYNETFVLHSWTVKKELQNRNIVVMTADWTNHNETIRRYLAKFGRSGIPFYAFYQPGRDPVVLSEFLTVKKVLTAITN